MPNFSIRITAHGFDSGAQSLEDAKDANTNQELEDLTVFVDAKFLIHALTEAGEKKDSGHWFRTCLQNLLTHLI